MENTLKKGCRHKLGQELWEDPVKRGARTVTMENEEEAGRRDSPWAFPERGQYPRTASKIMYNQSSSHGCSPGWPQGYQQN